MHSKATRHARVSTRRLPVLISTVAALMLAAACGSGAPATEVGDRVATGSREEPETPSSAGDSSPAMTPAGPVLLYGGDPSQASYRDNVFDRLAGPFRAETVDLDSLESAGLSLGPDREILEGPGDRPVYLIEGQPLDEGFFVRYAPNKGGGSEVDYPACTPLSGGGAYVFNAAGAEIDEPAFGPPPPRTGNPPPTPVPTPSWDPALVEISADDWLDAGWPDLSPERMALRYDGTRYDWVRHTYISSQREHEIPREALETVRVLEITYPLPELEDIPPELSGLVSSTTVTDRVRISRPESSSDSQAIVVENCAADLQPYEYAYYAPVGDDD